ncbi:DUF1045 domain-containing protein [Oceanidesulfovibrio marinus]|uniref:Xylose isomerase n=1 Tax=Oceanidesulfovibrio marinus TaxID=370038 RepID=A0A6P1ZH33_9BACT|nr:DUF1045 domain-containing protein [Oceanidesulfovibrio marinus]TVM33445.1 xylose isomerase [Oceanidesulfovibrio marinus]
MTARYGLYYAPESGSALAVLAATWLGRDAATGDTCAQPQLPGIPADILMERTASPRHYGFHATLKPPFALAPSRTEDELRASVAKFAQQQQPFGLHLAPGVLGGFVALQETTPSEELRTLAAACVIEFDGFRAPPAAKELEKRRAAGLTPRQDALLIRWGYPYVLDEFRFHMTLTSRVQENELRRAMLDAAGPYFAEALAEPITVDAVSLFHQPSREEPFTILDRFPFGSS